MSLTKTPPPFDRSEVLRRVEAGKQVSKVIEFPTVREVREEALKAFNSTAVSNVKAFPSQGGTLAFTEGTTSVDDFSHLMGIFSTEKKRA